jgi:hypothetical protein
MEEITTAAASLPDDVLLEILFCIRDDRASLFRCATVCKRWRRLIGDRSFLRRCWPTEKELYSLAGFFAHGRGHLRSEAGVAPFVPSPRSAMGLGRRALASFLPSGPADLQDHVEPLASRHGLLLVRLALGCLAVCNPIAGTCDLLPPLDWDTSNQGYAILTSTDYRSGGAQRPMPYFKVLVVVGMHGVYMFSSDETSWRCTSTQCFNNLSCLLNENAVVCRGTAHWLGRFVGVPELCTVNVNAETGHVSVTKLVANPEHGRYISTPCLSLDGGSTLSVISLIWMQTKHVKVEIWKQQDYKEGIDEDYDGTSILHCTRVVELKKSCETVPGRVSRILGERCGMLLVSNGEQLYVAHLETGIMEEVTNWPWRTINHRETQPFEMDWLEFFVSRLGGQ